MPMPAKPYRGRMWVSVDHGTKEWLKTTAYQLGYIRAGEGDIGQLLDAIASTATTESPLQKIFNAALDSVRKTV